MKKYDILKKKMYILRGKCKMLKKKKIKFTQLNPRVSFRKKMFKIKVHKRDGSIQYGYGLCGRQM